MKDKNGWITRRDFMRGTVGMALGTSLMGFEWAFGASNQTHSSLVTVVRDEKVIDITGSTIDTKILRKMLDKTVIHATGTKNIKDAWKQVVSQEDKIGIVPTGSLNPTHWELFYAIEDSLMEEGIARENIINAQGQLHSYGIDLCTILVSIPALKAHWVTGIGTVLKNYIMFSGRPAWYHGENSSKLGEIWHHPKVKGKTRLILVDALFPLCDRGPQVNPRYRWAYNGLIAGTDPVAVEAVCLHILEEKRATLKGRPWPISPPPICLEAADKIYKLGTSNLNEIKINLVGWQKDHLLPI